MKKLTLTLFLFGVLFDQVIAQPLKKGQNSINVYYGVSLVRTFYKNLAKDQAEDVKIKGIGPMGIVYEHMVTNKIGVGAEFGYGNTVVTYSYLATEFDPNTSASKEVMYNDKWVITSIRAQLRMNVHFIESDNFDGYGFMSAGYRAATGVFTSTNPNSINETVPSYVPVGIKIGLGLRYFFTESIGIQTEIALGTPAFSGGLAFKF